MRNLPHLCDCYLTMRRLDRLFCLGTMCCVSGAYYLEGFNYGYIPPVKGIDFPMQRFAASVLPVKDQFMGVRSTKVSYNINMKQLLCLLSISTLISPVTDLMQISNDKRESDSKQLSPNKANQDSKRSAVPCVSRGINSPGGLRDELPSEERLDVGMTDAGSVASE